MNPDVMKVANGKWPDILMSLGFSEKAMSGKHSPCPMCEGKDRFRVMEKAGGLRWICTQCGSGDGMNLVETALGLSFQEAAEKVRPLVAGASYSDMPKKPNQAEVKRNLEKIMGVWREAKDKELVSEYLKSRGLPPKAFSGADLRGGTIPHYDSDFKKTGDVPAMISRIITPQNRTVCLHRTYLFEESREKKITKAISTWTGGAIRLFKTTGEETLIVAEGIETALAARHMYKTNGNGTHPCWATVSANGMKKLAVPKNIKKVIVMGDNDANYTGQLAAYELANRLVIQNKIEVDVFIPKSEGDDWLDVLIRIEK